MDGKRIRCLQIVSQHVPIDLQQFPSYSNRKCKKLPFSRTAVHIFVSSGNAPATITQYVAWMERQFNACHTPRSMYLSIFNSFRVMRCLSQCVSPKIAILPHFCFPWGRPWDNHGKCCMDGKRIRCLQIVSQHVPIYLQVSQLFEPQVQKIAVFTYCSPHVCFPWRRPCDYDAKCCIDGKTIQCLPNASQHVPIYLQ